MPVKTIHCYISGRVQGVFFRASTQNKALELDIKGWVRNLGDGRVEIMASGRHDNIESFIKWLYEGPPMAVVEQIEFDDDNVLQQQEQIFTVK